jgi:hypothetical protein
MPEADKAWASPDPSWVLAHFEEETPFDIESIGEMLAFAKADATSIPAKAASVPDMWRDVDYEVPEQAQEVILVLGEKVVHGAWIGGMFWHNNRKVEATKWMPLPQPPNQEGQ